MTNTKELERVIAESGLKKSYIAKVLGLSRQSLRMKILNIHPFTTCEVQALCDLLHIGDLHAKEAIFFAPDVI